MSNKLYLGLMISICLWKSGLTELEMLAKTIQYTYKPLRESVYQETTSDKWDTPWYSVYIKRVLHNYFIPNHRKYVKLHGKI